MSGEGEGGSAAPRSWRRRTSSGLFALAAHAAVSALEPDASRDEADCGLLAVFARPRPRENDPRSLPAAVPTFGVCPLIRLYGPLAIDGTDARGLGQRATRGLIAQLALANRPVNVEELIEALWPGSDPARARPRLWKAAHQARRLLGEGLVRRGTAYALAADRISVDVREVERLGRAAAELPALERALALSTGAPLADVDYLWADAPRRHLRAVRGELLARAGRLRLRAGEPRLALGAAEELIALDRLHEPGWRLAMEAEAALGARQAVIARYDALSEELARDYGLRPQAQTRSIFRSLLAQG